MCIELEISFSWPQSNTLELGVSKMRTVILVLVLIAAALAAPLADIQGLHNLSAVCLLAITVMQCLCFIILAWIKLALGL